MTTARRFVLLDRDGTLIADRGYLRDPDQVELLPGAAEGLRRLRSLGLGLIVLTNQSGLGRGYFQESDLSAVHDRLCYLLLKEGVELDGLYVCPHRPSDGCRCRKPNTGLLEQAAREHHFFPAEAFVIGDKSSDIELGRAVGATTILVRTGYGSETERRRAVDADSVVDDLTVAAEVIQNLLFSGRASPRALSLQRENRS